MNVNIGTPAADAEGVSFLGFEAGRVKYGLEPGNHEFFSGSIMGETDHDSKARNSNSLPSVGTSDVH